MRYFRQQNHASDSQWRANGEKIEFRCNGSTWEDSICSLDDVLTDEGMIETDEDGNKLTPVPGGAGQ